jgi:hypothetical protein
MKKIGLLLMLTACGPNAEDEPGRVDAGDATRGADATVPPSDAEAVLPSDAAAPVPDASVPLAEADAAAPALDASAPAAALRVLFIGNSYTFYNDLEHLYADLRAADAPSREVVVARYARPGYRLEQHLADVQTEASELQGLFESRCGGTEPWTFVVLQEQSQIPGFPAQTPEFQASVAAARAWGERVRGCGATPVLFETWGRLRGDEANPELFPDFSTMQDRLDEGFTAMREAGTLTSASVGGAFRWLSGRPDFDFAQLYSGDGSHPSLAGSWLAALVLAGVTPSRDAPAEPRGPAGLSTAVLEALEAAAAAAIIPVP